MHIGGINSGIKQQYFKLMLQNYILLLVWSKGNFVHNL